MTLAMQTRSASDFQRGLLRRSSQNLTSGPSSPVVEAVDFCRSKPRLVELEKQLYYLANGDGNLQEVMKTCQSLLSDCGSVNGIFNVFCSCSWVDRYCEPVISQLFYELVSSQHASSNGTLLLTELETACEELLKVLTHLGTPNTLQFNVVSLLYNLSRLSSLPSSHQEAVQSYLEEIARALWPYSKPSAPNLWANEAFCDAQCDILKACGKVLEEKCPVNTERTFQMIIGKLVSGDISKYSRFRLLEIRELRSSGWKVSAATMNYYKESYLKFINQSRKGKLLNEVSPSSKNELETTNPLGESKNQTNIKPVTVVRITESELWKSCEDIQEELLTQEVIAEEKNAVVDGKSCSLVDCTDLLAKLKICDEDVRHKEPSNVSYSKGNPFLYRTDLEEAQQPGNSDEDEGGAGVRSSKEKEEIKHSKSQTSSQDFTDDNLGRASSPSNSDGSDEVFADTSRPSSTEINAVHKNKVLPALHRGEFKKPRRPFKSDSSVISGSESVEARTTSSLDTKESSCNSKSTLARSQSEVTTTFEHENISCGLGTETDPVVVPALNDIENSKIVCNESKVVDEQDHSSGNVMENWRERKLPSTDNSWRDKNGEKSARQNWRERKFPFSTAVDSDSQEHKNGPGSVVQNWRERPSVDFKESSESNHSSDASNENWSERKLSFSTVNSDSQEHKNGPSSVIQNWRERPSLDLKESSESNHSSDASNENWNERKLSFSTVNSDSQEHKNGPSSVIQNWRERPSVDLKESESNHSNNASTENWRERNSDNLGDCRNKGPQHLNWRDRKSISVDESRKDATCNPSFGGRSQRHSTGDIQFLRQDSYEKGKHSAGGGFGLPKPSGQDDQTLTPSDELPLEELHEVQITEEESQGLKGWKLGEIKYDTGCRIFHNRDKCIIEIRGDPQQCKVAKNRVYSVIAAVQEEFGALVPLSDEVIEHLQIEGCNVLAERLALFSGASVKMINDTQLFISGHRTSVNLAKAQLAKIKVMLRYTDDPDVQSPSQQNIIVEKYQLVEKLFSALEERPRRATDPGCTDQATMKESLSREFLLSCALSPVARQRPAGLSLDRTEDWVKDIVLVNGRRGEQAVLERKGFGLPTLDSRPPSS